MNDPIIQSSNHMNERLILITSDLNKDSPNPTNFSNELKWDNTEDILPLYYLLLLLSIKGTF